MRTWCSEGVADGEVENSPSVGIVLNSWSLELPCGDFIFDESGAGRNRLPIPLTTTPGCIPRKGVSKLIVPKIRCWNISLLGCFSKATSADRIPPMLCPRRIISVFGDSWGASLYTISSMAVKSYQVTAEISHHLLKSSLAYSIAFLDLYFGYILVWTTCVSANRAVTTLCT